MIFAQMSIVPVRIRSMTIYEYQQRLVAAPIVPDWFLLYSKLKITVID